ncbi:hypothetical protein BD770DRAFT_383347 [Pilaira anomala]|nr:hypothetical protein BD770DRAFT_383347 [Pilaira anomala]
MKFSVILFALFLTISLVFVEARAIGKPLLVAVALERIVDFVQDSNSQKNPELIQKRGAGGRCPYIYCVEDDDDMTV